MVKRLLLFIILSSILFTGCKTLYSNRMLETPKDYKFDALPPIDNKEEFKLATNDEFTFKLFTNDGYKLVDMNVNSSSTTPGGRTLSYIIKNDGFSKLPLLGLIKLSGLTIAQAEDTLESKFSEFYIKPFVLLNVSNRKIIFFASGEGDAKLIPIQGNTISLIEAIAQAGGIPKYGRAYSIKIIRGEVRNPIVYMVDLSTLEGYKVGNIILQSNDIVYIDAREGVARNLRNEITPYLGLISSLLITVLYFTRIKNI